MSLVNSSVDSDDGTRINSASLRRSRSASPGEECFIQHKKVACSSYAGDEVKFEIKEYQKDAFQMLLQMKTNNILTDVKLEVCGEIFPAHRVVLAAASPYFKAMFTGGLSECEMSTVKLQGLGPEVLQYLLCFMYTGKIVINELMVCSILSAATMLQMSHAVEACCNFLEQQMEASNVIGIANYSFQHGCMELYAKANVFIEQHFAEVSQGDEFLQMNACQVIDLIRRDELNVPDEKSVYNAVLKWVMHDGDRRRPKMEHILHKVRLEPVSTIVKSRVKYFIMNSK